MTDATPTDTETKTNSAGRGFLKRLKAGDYGLAMTFWVYSLILPWVISFALQSFGGNLIAGVVFIVGLLYTVFICLPGIWNATKNYNGKYIWAILAKVFVVFMAFGFALMTLSFLLLGGAIIAA